jgi:hypothetical protein
VWGSIGAIDSEYVSPIARYSRVPVLFYSEQISALVQLSEALCQICAVTNWLELTAQIMAKVMLF